MTSRRVLPISLGIVLIAALACRGVALAQPANAAALARTAKPDWPAIDAQALNYFRTYLRFDTSDPPGDTTAAIAFLKGILDQAGIATATFTSAPGQVNLVAKLPGPPGLKPFLMMSHADVVPAVASHWSHPPFSADLAGGYVWARGAIDNKAHGIMALMTMLEFKREGAPLRRGLEMMVNSSEEVGGNQGAGFMVREHWDAIDPAFAVNEGGDATGNWLGARGLVFRVAVSEKRVLWLRLTAHGRAGHGSMPNADNPTLILIDALARLVRNQPPLHLTPVFTRAMGMLAARTAFPESFELSHLRWPLMLGMAARGPLRGYAIQALMRDTIAPTVLAAGVKVNVIPAIASAEVDCRLLTDSNPKQFLSAIVRKIDDPRVSIEILQKPGAAPPSPAAGEAWNAIVSVVGRDFPGALVVPWVTSGGTDSRYLREKGVPSYGFIPVILSKGEARRIHGVDERLSIVNLNRGIRATYDLATVLCAMPRAAR